MQNAAMLAQVILNGLSLSAVYILMALGFTLIFGIMRIVNFAHGEMCMLGGFALFYLYGTLKLNFFLALVLAVALVGVLTIPVERLVFRPFYGKELPGMIATLGLSVTLQHLGVIAWGTYERAVPPAVTGSLHFSGLILPLDRVVLIIVSLVALGAFYVFMRFTKAGLAMRAAAQDFEVARVQGIASGRIYILAYVVATMLAALAGGMLGQLFSLSPFMGQLPLIKAFIVVILGGLGSIPGAVVGGLLMGMAESALQTYVGGAAAEFIAFGAIIALLVWRPWGLMGRPEAQ